MEYLKAIFTLNVAANDEQAAKDLLADLAAAAGFEAFEESEEGLTGYVQPHLLDKETLDEAIADFPIASARIEYEMEEAENRNWNEEWEANGFEPICIENKCVIYDARHYSPEDLPANMSLQVGIEPRQAFGTGTHETTRMVVQQLLSLQLAGKHLLDCGCGTGILGIVAAKLGAESVLGYDIDEWSVDNSLHNATLNGVKNMVVVKGDATALNAEKKYFDVVVANINRNILLADLPLWVEKTTPKGTIVLSGFYQTDTPILVEAAKTLGLALTSQKELDGWACLTFGKQ